MTVSIDRPTSSVSAMPVAGGFREFAIAVNQRLQQLEGSFAEFYKVDCPEIFDYYLNAFPEGTNPIFRERTEHDCQCCKQFIRNLGAIIAIKDGQIYTVWQGLTGISDTYATVAGEMDRIVRSSPILSVFRTGEINFGHEKNFDSYDAIIWYHFYGNTPSRCISRSPGEDIGKVNSVHDVFKRGLEIIKSSDLDEIITLIDDNQIYRGEEHRKSVAEFRSLKRGYERAENKELYVWEHVGNPAARFKNTVIGTLAVDLSEGAEQEKAIKSFESKVAPANYKRPKALITPRMIEDAVATLKRLDLEDSISRRFASIEDISVNDIIFIDNDVRGKAKGGLTDLLMEEVRPIASARKGEEIGIEQFIAMRSKRIELVLENRHLNNFVSITAPAIPDSPSLFKWDNAFGWSYDGDVADSIKERVKTAGGNINALLRCSLAWFNYDDLDIHCIDPRGTHIYYGATRGILDVDMNAGLGRSREPVENLSWNQITDGEYKIYVNNFCRRETADPGFQLQVEFAGSIHEFSCDTSPMPGEGHPDPGVHCLTLVVEGGELAEIKTHGKLSGSAAIAREKWGVKTNTPTKVNVLMLSPNHWENSSKTGNRHYFFILDKCLNPEPARGIFNEFLMSSLEQHRRVFEVLGNKTKCQPSNNQLSGVGFSSTRSDSVNVIADGRPFTIKF